jgi:hypothetical protein
MAILSTVFTTEAIPGTLFSSAGNTAITTMYICNKTTSTVVANLFVVPSGNSELYGNLMIYSNLSIAANDTYILEWERILLSNGDSLRGNASAALSLISTVSYTGI